MNRPGILLLCAALALALAFARPAQAEEGANDDEASESDAGNDDGSDDAPDEADSKQEDESPPSPTEGETEADDGHDETPKSATGAAPRDVPATQQAKRPLVPPGFNVQTYRKSYVRQLRGQARLLLSLGTGVLIGQIPGTFGLGLLVTALTFDSAFEGDDMAAFLIPLVTSNLSAHITFAAITAITRGVMDLKIANKLGRLHADDSRRRRHLLAGWAFGPPAARPLRAQQVAWAGGR